MKETNTPSRAFEPEFYADFVQRLNYDRKHNNAATADPFWTVQEVELREKVPEFGYDAYKVTDKDHNQYDSVWVFHEALLDEIVADKESDRLHSILKSNSFNLPSTDEVEIIVDKWNDDIEPSAKELQAAWESFEGSISEDDFKEILDDHEDYMIWHYKKNYKTASINLTRDGALAHIERKSHELRDPRVYVESAYWSAEFKAILNGLADGTLIHADTVPSSSPHKLITAGLIAFLAGVSVALAASTFVCEVVL